MKSAVGVANDSELLHSRGTVAELSLRAAEQKSPSGEAKDKLLLHSVVKSCAASTSCAEKSDSGEAKRYSLSLIFSLVSTSRCDISISLVVKSDSGDE